MPPNDYILRPFAKSLDESLAMLLVLITGIPRPSGDRHGYRSDCSEIAALLPYARRNVYRIRGGGVGVIDSGMFLGVLFLLAVGKRLLVTYFGSQHGDDETMES